MQYCAFGSRVRQVGIFLQSNFYNSQIIKKEHESNFPETTSSGNINEVVCLRKRNWIWKLQGRSRKVYLADRL